MILLRKNANDDSMLPGSFRPICIGDSINKVMEKAIKKKIYDHLGYPAFHPLQFRFSKNKSTMDALEYLTEYIQNNNAKGYYGFMVSLDVKNAFNSVSWKNIFESLIKRDFPLHLRNLLQNFFYKRFVVYKASNKWIKIPTKRGVPQGSVLSPIIWNILYDELLSLDFSESVKVIAYADDVAVFSANNSLQRVKRDLEANINEKIAPWLTKMGLQMSPQKTGVMSPSSLVLIGRFYLQILVSIYWETLYP